MAFPRRVFVSPGISLVCAIPALTMLSQNTTAYKYFVLLFYSNLILFKIVLGFADAISNYEDIRLAGLFNRIQFQQ